LLCRNGVNKIFFRVEELLVHLIYRYKQIVGILRNLESRNSPLFIWNFLSNSHQVKIISGIIDCAAIEKLKEILV